MKEVYLLFSCDAWHTHTSQKLLGVFSKKNLLIDYAKSYGDLKLSDNDIKNLKTINQTQGRDLNLLILTEPLNPQQPF